MFWHDSHNYWNLATILWHYSPKDWQLILPMFGSNLPKLCFKLSKICIGVPNPPKSGAFPSRSHFLKQNWRLRMLWTAPWCKIAIWKRSEISIFKLLSSGSWLFQIFRDFFVYLLAAVIPMYILYLLFVEFWWIFMDKSWDTTSERIPSQSRAK